MRIIKISLLVAATILSQLSYAEDFLINHETHFKKTAEQSSSLPDSDKCLVEPGTLVSADSIENSSTHYKVVLQNNLSNCSFTTGYFYQPHIDRENKLLTLTHHTVFKKLRLDSSQLPESDKCDAAPGVYAAQENIADVESGHYYLNLREFLPNCSFSQGYFWEGHAQQGSLAIQITYATVFKKEPKQSSDLAPEDTCEMPVGSYALGANATASGETHYQITLAESLPQCSFNTGYVFYDHTGWAKPYIPPAEPEWTFPVPGGYYTSGWCICRNIGTSPHIGQDISKSGSKSAVIVQDGVLESTSFSSSCGYISYVRDDFDTLWRYVHLNNPSISAGSQVSAGQHLGVLSTYPKSGCGNGAHLHFERRSAGYFADSITGKSCQNGYRSCYYDPIKPWRTTSSVNRVEKNTLSVKSNWSEHAPLSSQQCKVPVSNLPEVSRERFDQFKTLHDEEVIVEFDVRSRMTKPNVFSSQVFVKDNQDNLCSETQRCLVQWQLVSESSEGQLTSVFFHNRVRNVRLVRETEEKHCLPNNPTKRWILLKDNFGKQWKVDLLQLATQ